MSSRGATALLRRMALLAAAIFAALPQAGCLRQAMVDAQASAIRDASPHGATLHDYEIGLMVGRSGIGQLEGLYALSPGNEDVLFLLTRAWSGITFAFTLDDYEEALVRGDATGAEYQLRRASAGFARARFFGVLLLRARADGFDEARKSGDALDRWLEESFDDPAAAEELLTVAFAWLMHAVVASDDPTVGAEMYVGLGLLQRAMRLDPNVGNGAGHMLLGALDARPVGGDLPRAKAHFDKAIEATSGRYLPAKLLFATRYLCAKGDREGYERTLESIVAAGDVMPAQRFPNLVAQRRARRYLRYPIFRRNCAFG